MLKSIYRSHFFVQLLCPIIALSILPALILGIIINSIFSDYQLNYIRQESIHASEQIAAEIENIIDGYNEIISSIAENPKIEEAMSGNKNYDRDVTNAITTNMFRMKGRIEIHIISFIDSEHRFSSGSIPHLYRYDVHKVWNRSIFHEIELHPKSTISHPTHYTAKATTDSIVLSLGRAIVKGGKTVGCVILDIYRSELFDIAKSYQANDIQRVRLFDKGKHVILDTLNVYCEGLVDSSMPGNLSLSSIETSQTKEMTITLCGIEKYGIFVTNQWSTMSQAATQQEMKTIAALVLLIVVPVCVIIAWIIAKKQTRPLTDIKLAMEQAAIGNWDTKLELNRADEMLVLEEGFNHMISQLKQYTEEKVEQESAMKEAQMRSLQAQINPHFLMNTLASIRALARKHGVKDIQSIADDLSALFAYNVYGASEMITLNEDLVIISKYLAIQNIRFNNKFTLEVIVPEDLLEMRLPPLILQPIVENAIIHGLEDKIGKGIIRISAYRAIDNRIHISIWDNGIGMNKEIVNSINLETDYDNKSHIGLKNAKHRIMLCFGPESKLWIESELGAYTMVHIEVNILSNDKQ